MPDSISIDSYGPLSVVSPNTVAEAGDLISQAATEKKAIYPLGGGTALGIGLPPATPGFALDMRSLNSLIDYPAADMTVTVQAGMTIETLQQLLAREKQWLPVDLALPQKATLGGAIAVNASGPRRLGYGTLRDYLIGISFLTDGGEEVKGGGRVVKNVAGYDLMKLHLGALGTLGVITQLTFKVKPLPEERVAVAFGVSTSQIAKTLDLLHQSNSRPIAVELLNSAAAKAIGLAIDSPWTVIVGFEEKAVTVKWQIETLLKDLNISTTVKTGAEAAAIWPLITELPCRPESRFVWKASVLPSQVAEVVSSAEGKADLIHAHAMNGIVWFHANEDRGLTVLGTIVCCTAPSNWKTAERLWGKPSSDACLKAQIKRTLDPKNVFNPGRVF